MSEKKKSGTISRYFLSYLLFFEGFGATVGGISFITDPSGSSIRMQLKFLEGTLFHNYLIPGWILLIFLGLFPLFLVYPIIKKPKWRWANLLNIYKSMHWAWTYALFTGIMLIIWIDVQIIMIGYSNFIQALFAGLGLLITITTLLPGNIKYFTIEDKPAIPVE